MPFTSYSDLETSIAGFINRGDLVAQIPDFIALTEAKIKRKLRRTTVQADITLAAQSNQLPTDVAELRSIHLNSGSPTLDTDLKVVTASQLAEYAARYDGVAGRPVAVTVLSGQPAVLLVAPVPDQFYPCTITYYQQITPLSNTNPTNPVFLESPDLYLYGALCEAGKYLEDDDRLPQWKADFDEALDDLAKARDREEAGAGMRPIRLAYGGFC